MPILALEARHDLRDLCGHGLLAVLCPRFGMMICPASADTDRASLTAPRRMPQPPDPPVSLLCSPLDLRHLKATLGEGFAEPCSFISHNLVGRHDMPSR